MTAAKNCKFFVFTTNSNKEFCCPEDYFWNLKEVEAFQKKHGNDWWKNFAFVHNNNVYLFRNAMNLYECWVRYDPDSQENFQMTEEQARQRLHAESESVKEGSWAR